MKIQSKIGKCYICGEKLENFVEQVDAKCVKCGKEEKTNIVCEKGHYLCEKCAGMNTIDIMRERMLSYEDKDPLAITEKLIRDCGIYGNSPHSLVTAAFLVAYRNLTNKIDDATIMIGFERAVGIPGGWCGFYGTCGAAVGIGTAFSVIMGATPLSNQERSIANRVTANALYKVADMGGPRCCISSIRASIISGCEMLAELGVTFSKSEWWSKGCSVSEQNFECKKDKCPYFVCTDN